MIKIPLRMLLLPLQPQPLITTAITTPRIHNTCPKQPTCHALRLTDEAQGERVSTGPTDTPFLLPQVHAAAGHVGDMSEPIPKRQMRLRHRIEKGGWGFFGIFGFQSFESLCRICSLFSAPLSSFSFFIFSFCFFLFTVLLFFRFSSSSATSLSVPPFLSLFAKYVILKYPMVFYSSITP